MDEPELPAEWNGWTAERMAEFTTASVWDVPALETRKEFKGALLQCFEPMFAELLKARPAVDALATLQVLLGLCDEANPWLGVVASVARNMRQVCDAQERADNRYDEARQECDRLRSELIADRGEVGRLKDNVRKLREVVACACALCRSWVHISTLTHWHRVIAETAPVHAAEVSTEHGQAGDPDTPTATEEEDSKK